MTSAVIGVYGNLPPLPPVVRPSAFQRRDRRSAVHGCHCVAGCHVGQPHAGYFSSLNGFFFVKKKLKEFSGNMTKRLMYCIRGKK
jgi:hypothetical protein